MLHRESSEMCTLGGWGPVVNQAIILNTCRVVRKFFDAVWSGSFLMSCGQEVFWCRVVRKFFDAVWSGSFLTERWIRNVWSVGPLLFWERAELLKWEVWMISIIINTEEALNKNNQTGTRWRQFRTAAETGRAPHFTSPGCIAACRRGASRRNVVAGLEGQQRRPCCP